MANVPIFLCLPVNRCEYFHVIPKTSAGLPGDGDTRDQWGKFSVASMIVRAETWLAIVAIGFAVVQYFDSRELRRQTIEIAQSTSTRFVGTFPKNIEQITEVINKTTNHLDVMVDFAGYGHYSNPDDFRHYFQTLKAKRPKNVVRLMVYSAKQASLSQTTQFDFEKERVSTRFTNFFTVVHSGQQPPASAMEFDARLDEYQTTYKRELCDAGVQIRTVDHPLLFFLWLEDSEEAAFSFQNTGEREREISTRTRDANLIDPLHHVFVETWNKDGADFCNASAKHEEAAQVTAK